MRVKIFLFFAFIVIGFCLCLMPPGIEAYPHNRNGASKCPTTCSIFCPCGNILDKLGCPICRCRPSNICTGRHPNNHPRQRQSQSKSHILY
jgi:hypothetical protein